MKKVQAYECNRCGAIGTKKQIRRCEDRHRAQEKRVADEKKRRAAMYKQLEKIYSTDTPQAMAAGIPGSLFVFARQSSRFKKREVNLNENYNIGFDTAPRVLHQSTG